MATNFLRFCRAGSVNGMAFAGGVSGVGCAVGRIYTGFGQERALLAVGCLLLGQWTFGALLFLPFHYPPQSALGRFLLFAVYIAPPLWCQSDTLFLDSPPLDVRWIDAGCQFSKQFHFGTHPIPCSGSSLLCQFPDWPGQSLSSAH